ncbi:MAG: hypothetical protein ACYDAG_00270 [Chloroflexota bacterium]
MSTAYQSATELLLQQLETHERSEEEVLHAYGQAAQDAPDPGVRFLMGLIVEDEARHHRLMSAMALGLRQSFDQAEGPGLLPSVSASPEVATTLRAQTERFLEAEREALRAMKDLEHTVKWVESDGRALSGAVELLKPERTAQWMRAAPLDLILDVIVDDTKKHIRILEYIRKRLSAVGG